MEISAKLTEFLTWGRFVNVYTVYRIDVTYKGDDWFIFRRFSEFTDLHSSFLNSQDLKELAEPLTEVLPEKGRFGSSLATINSVCSARKERFTQYLEAILLEKALYTSPAFLSFIDVEFKGISGIKRVLGTDHVMREDFALCSQGRLASIGVNSWVRSYICVTKKGWIYCTNCLYNTPDECDVKVDLKSRHTRIGGDASKDVLHVTCNNVSLYVKFSDKKMSSWLRLLSDFSINTAQSSAVKEKTVKQERRRSSSSTHIKAAGTGNTEDSLAAEYGI